MGFIVNPFTQTVGVGVAATITITQQSQLTQSYVMSDGAGGGTLTPSSLTIAGGVGGES